MASVTLLKTGNASLDASWRRLACAGDKRARARAYTPKRRGESALQSMVKNEIKTQMIGEAPDLDKQLQILNRTVRWSSRGPWIEANPRHVKKVIKALGFLWFQSSPHAGSSGHEDNEGSTGPELGREETTMFRAVGARLNYLSQDRPDITFATMKLCSKMSRPDAQDLKNHEESGVGSSLERPRVGCLFEWQAPSRCLARPC